MTVGLEFKEAMYIKPSPMEYIIMRELKKRKVKFHREVIFNGCNNPITNMPLRYDFYIPCLNLIVEYDGKQFHNTDDIKAKDTYKDFFDNKNNINIIRLVGQKAIDNFIDTYLQEYPDTNKIKKVLPPLKELKRQKKKEKYIATFKVGDRPKRPFCNSDSEYRHLFNVWKQTMINSRPVV